MTHPTRIDDIDLAHEVALIEFSSTGDQMIGLSADQVAELAAEMLEYPIYVAAMKTVGWRVAPYYEWLAAWYLAGTALAEKE